MVPPKSVMSAILGTRDNHSMGDDVVFTCRGKSYGRRLDFSCLTVEVPHRTEGLSVTGATDQHFLIMNYQFNV